MTGYPRTTRIHSIASLSCPAMPTGPITEFIKHHYRHFNAAALLAAAEDYTKHLASGGEKLVTLAGGMSTAEPWVSPAEVIRHENGHALRCNRAQLEGDTFQPVGHGHH